MDKKTEKEAEEKEETERQIKQRRKGKNKTKENGGRGFGLQTSDGDEPIFESENCVQLSPLVADGFFSSSSSSLFVSCVSLFFFSFVFFCIFTSVGCRRREKNPAWEMTRSILVNDKRNKK